MMPIWLQPRSPVDASRMDETSDTVAVDGNPSGPLKFAQTVQSLTVLHTQGSLGAYVAAQATGTGRRMEDAGEFVGETDAEVAARHGLDLKGLTK